MDDFFLICKNIFEDYLQEVSLGNIQETRGLRVNLTCRMTPDIFYKGKQEEIRLCF